MGDVKIEIHPLTNEPLKAWQKMKVHQNQKSVSPLSWDTPMNEDYVRFVCISDTHSAIESNEKFKVPPGDVLLHAGDFTCVGLPLKVNMFNSFLGTLPHKVKLVIAGNHELTFDDKFVKEERQDLLTSFRITPASFEETLKEMNISHIKELLTNCIYLEDNSVNVCGIKVYGTPWQPEFCGWGFNLERGQQCLEKWDCIPSDTDVLISHGPPIGYGDKVRGGNRAGCVELLSTIQKRVKPKYHVFGHIHEDPGVFTDGTTTFINASTCDLSYKPNHPPIIFDMPIPEGHSKDELLHVSKD